MKNKSVLFTILCLFTMLFVTACADGMKLTADYDGSSFTSNTGSGTGSGTGTGTGTSDGTGSSTSDNPFTGTTWKQSYDGEILSNGNTITFTSSTTAKEVTAYTSQGNDYTYTVSTSAGSYTAKFKFMGQDIGITFTINGKNATKATYYVPGGSYLEYTKQ